MARPHIEQAQALRVSAKPILLAAARAWGLEYGSLISADRSVPLPEARFAAMLVLRRQGWSLKAIALGLGRSDHKTVLHGIGCAERLVRQDPGFAVAVATIEHIAPPERIAA